MNKQAKCEIESDFVRFFVFFSLKKRSEFVRLWQNVSLIMKYVYKNVVLQMTGQKRKQLWTLLFSDRQPSHQRVNMDS